MYFYRFIVFVLYIIQLKRSRIIHDPKTTTGANISSLQTMVCMSMIFVISFFGANLATLLPILLILMIIIYIYNYRLCVKNDYLDKIQHQFEGSAMNTVKNRRIAIGTTMLVLATSIGLIIILSYLKSKNVF